jgi:hypothetical protein
MPDAAKKSHPKSPTERISQTAKQVGQQVRSTEEQLGAAGEQLREQVRSAAEQLSTAGEQTFVPLLRSYSAWLDSVTNVQAEALRFTLDRMRKSMEMPSRLAECKAPTELFEVQADFARTMVSDYVTESERLLSLSLEGLRNSAGEASRMTEAHPGGSARRAA